MKGSKTMRVRQRELGLSERRLAEKASVSRETLRSVLRDDENVTVKNIEKVSHALGLEPSLSLVPPDAPEIHSEDSVVAVSLLIAQGKKWTIHLFDFVDAFRRTKDVRLVILPPVSGLPIRYAALLASTVSQMCADLGFDIPAWASRDLFLPAPWFVSGIEALKAMAIQESPFYFRRNNIFVLDNFLARA